ncbi:MAG: GTP-binding protein, partial [Pseudomonadota bacterium]
VQVLDTAGIRKKKMVNGPIEIQAVYRALHSISEAEVVLYVVDATKGLAHQDCRLLDIAKEQGKSLVICLNKVDLLRNTMKDKKKQKEWLEEFRYRIPWLNFCELVPISAKTGMGMGALKKALAETILIRHGQIPTREINQVVSDLLGRNSLLVDSSTQKELKVRYATLVKSNPPTFLLFSNRSKGIPKTYRRYLQNGLRDAFTLKNTPIHIIFRRNSQLAHDKGKNKNR